MTTDDDLQASPLDDVLNEAIVENAEPPMDEPPETDPSVTEEPTAEEIIEALEAPQKWDKRYKEVFANLASTDDKGTPLYPNGTEVQQTMLDMYGEVQGYATKVEQERAEARKQLEQFQGITHEWNDVLTPYQKMIAESGTTPTAFARQAFGLAQALKNDPQATLLRLAKTANVDLRAALEGQEWQSPESKELAALKERLDRQERERLQREENYARQAQYRIEQECKQQVQTFAEATDESGKLLHPHLDKVKDEMTQLILGRAAQRDRDPTYSMMELQEAYDSACKSHPDVTQETKVKAEVTDAARKAAEAKKATDAARRVSAGTSGKGKPLLNLDEQLDAAIAKNAA